VAVIANLNYHINNHNKLLNMLNTVVTALTFCAKHFLQHASFAY